MIDNIKIKIKDLVTKARYKLIGLLGGCVFPPIVPDTVVKPEAQVNNIVNISASTIVSWNRYSKDRGYREYIKSELAHILADHIIDEKLMSQEGIVEINDNECVVKVTAKLVKGGAE